MIKSNGGDRKVTHRLALHASKNCELILDHHHFVNHFPVTLPPFEGLAWEGNHAPEYCTAASSNTNLVGATMDDQPMLSAQGSSHGLQVIANQLGYFSLPYPAEIFRRPQGWPP